MTGKNFVRQLIHRTTVSLQAPALRDNSFRVVLEGKAPYSLGIPNLQHPCAVCISVHNCSGVFSKHFVSTNTQWGWQWWAVNLQLVFALGGGAANNCPSGRVGSKTHEEPISSLP